jgi:hypothetical protein
MVGLALPIILHTSSIPMGTRLEVEIIGVCPFTTNDFISAISLTKRATALGKFSIEISFTSIIVIFNYYGANETSVFPVFHDTEETLRKHMKLL